MRRTILALTFAVPAVLASAIVGTAQAPASGGHLLATPSQITWEPGPPALPAGMQAVILEGDLSKPGAFTVRAKMPDGYVVPPHFHPGDEHVTVLQGTLFMGMGEKLDKTGGHELPAGSFAMMPKGTKHFVWTKGETIIQIHGIGPWDITYVNPKDDPRKKTSN
ncbi:MAG TPA: cupin domain-containing protein [Vicinamibacterales bacterium]